MRVTTPRGDLVTLKVLVAGAVAGEQALLSGKHRRMATVVALERTETLVIEESSLPRFATYIGQSPPL